ncbi:hypothetical protein C8R41DRAFT_230632 [Lentinula lateritia]|uniref:Uncharacterized protein n=1 Tax=Lentinula lateritia TaxID=40482 RepID=A0ABQ8VL98_9AGAR|nr:hypothetical protein C8R41DRAFT_230632 [Lentinula lateritia]
MSNGNTKDVSGSSLLRTRSAGDPSFSPSDLGVPRTGASHLSSDHFFSSTVITIPKRASRGPHSAGPSFNAFFPESIPKKRENQVIAAICSSPRIPPPAILHPPPTPIPMNNTIPAPPLRRPVHTHHSPVARLLHFFGYGNDASKVRKELVSLIWRLGWGFAQMVSIVVVLALFAPKASPTVPGANEWTACNRPLGVWSCLWLGRTIVGGGLLGMDSRPIHNRNTRIDPESGQRASNSEHLEQTRSHNPQQPPFPSINSPQTQNDHLPHTVMFRRFSLFSSMYGIIWFLTAYILVCTSLKTCRLSSPHIWWLTIAILCTMYLKFILLSLIVSVFALVFSIWNILLRCTTKSNTENTDHQTGHQEAP